MTEKPASASAFGIDQPKLARIDHRISVAGERRIHPDANCDCADIHQCGYSQ